MNGRRFYPFQVVKMSPAPSAATALRRFRWSAEAAENQLCQALSFNQLSFVDSAFAFAQ